MTLQCFFPVAECLSWLTRRIAQSLLKFSQASSKENLEYWIQTLEIVAQRHHYFVWKRSKEFGGRLSTVDLPQSSLQVIPSLIQVVQGRVNRTQQIRALQVLKFCPTHVGLLASQQLTLPILRSLQIAPWQISQWDHGLLRSAAQRRNNPCLKAFCRLRNRGERPSKFQRQRSFRKQSPNRREINWRPFPTTTSCFISFSRTNTMGPSPNPWRTAKPWTPFSTKRWQLGVHWAKTRTSHAW